MKKGRQLKTAFNVILKDMLDKFGYFTLKNFDIRDIIINETVVLLLKEVEIKHK